MGFRKGNDRNTFPWAIKCVTMIVFICSNNSVNASAKVSETKFSALSHNKAALTRR